MKEAEVALMLSHEISHYLLEHQVSRLASFFGELYVRPRMFDLKKELRDAIKEEFKEKTVLQKISCFYPQQRCVDKFIERHCDTLALHLWRKAYPNEASNQIITTLYGENLAEHLSKTPRLISEKVTFDPVFTYKREETLLHLSS